VDKRRERAKEIGRHVNIEKGKNWGGRRKIRLKCGERDQPGVKGSYEKQERKKKMFGGRCSGGKEPLRRRCSPQAGKKRLGKGLKRQTAREKRKGRGC